MFIVRKRVCVVVCGACTLFTFPLVINFCCVQAQRQEEKDSRDQKLEQQLAHIAIEDNQNEAEAEDKAGEEGRT